MKIALAGLQTTLKAWSWSLEAWSCVEISIIELLSDFRVTYVETCVY